MWVVLVLILAVSFEMWVVLVLDAHFENLLVCTSLHSLPTVWYYRSDTRGAGQSRSVNLLSRRPSIVQSAESKTKIYPNLKPGPVKNQNRNRKRLTTPMSVPEAKRGRGLDCASSTCSKQPHWIYVKADVQRILTDDEENTGRQFSDGSSDMALPAKRKQKSTVTSGKRGLVRVGTRLIDGEDTSDDEVWANRDLAGKGRRSKRDKTRRLHSLLGSLPLAKTRVRAQGSKRECHVISTVLVAFSTTLTTCGIFICRYGSLCTRHYCIETTKWFILFRIWIIACFSFFPRTKTIWKISRHDFFFN